MQLSAKTRTAAKRNYAVSVSARKTGPRHPNADKNEYLYIDINE